jgi:hypothetical protein
MKIEEFEEIASPSVEILRPPCLRRREDWLPILIKDCFLYFCFLVENFVSLLVYRKLFPCSNILVVLMWHFYLPTFRSI